MIASWSKTIQSVLASGPRVLFLPTKQSARPIYSHDNATWKSSIEAHLSGAQPPTHVHADATAPALAHIDALTIQCHFSLPTSLSPLSESVLSGFFMLVWRHRTSVGTHWCSDHPMPFQPSYQSISPLWKCTFWFPYACATPCFSLFHLLICHALKFFFPKLYVYVNKEKWKIQKRCRAYACVWLLR